MSGLLYGPIVAVNCLHSAVANAWVTLGDGIAAIPADAGDAMEVLSSDANDAAAGAGMRTATIDFIKADGTLDSETITLNGTTAVACAQVAIKRIVGVAGLTYGTGLTNAGAITVRKITGPSNRLQILAGRNRAHPGQFTVPIGWTCEFLGAVFNNAMVSATVPLRTTIQVEVEMNPSTGAYLAGAFNPIGVCTISANKAGSIMVPSLGYQDRERESGISIPQLATIRARAITESASTSELSGIIWLRARQSP